MEVKRTMSQYQSAATRVQQYLMMSHLADAALLGPDPGVRLNYRFGRFVKGYLPALPWRDDLYYVQGQGYWVLGNWSLADRTGDASYADLAVRASDQMLARQRADGAWDYPNPEWKGRVANAEGSWGSIGLLESHRKTGAPRFLEGVLRWHHYLTDQIGYQQDGDQLAVNYFGARDGSRVPNNSAFVLRFLAELEQATGDPSYSRPCQGMLAFLSAYQMPSGEFPYAVHGLESEGDRPHYQCFQYNAFQCLDLIRYWELTGDTTALPLVRAVLSFLSGGVGPDGRAFYDCDNHWGTVTYHAAALGAAFARASQTGIGDYNELAARSFGYVLRLQRPDGSFRHSGGDYRLLSDQRSYPRYLAMIMYHLLLGDGQAQAGQVIVGDRASVVAG